MICKALAIVLYLYGGFCVLIYFGSLFVCCSGTVPLIRLLARERVAEIKLGLRVCCPLHTWSNKRTENQGEKRKTLHKKVNKG